MTSAYTPLSTARTPWWAATATVLRPLLIPLLVSLAVLWLSRIGLSVWQSTRVSDTQAWSHVWMQGLRFDAVLLGIVWALPAALTPWMAMGRLSFALWLKVLRVFGLVTVVFIAFMELSTPAFVDQYDSRPNYLFVEYLNYAKEVGGTLIKDYWPHILITSLLLPALAMFYWRVSRPKAAYPKLSLLQAVPLSLLLLALFAVGGRGAFGHRAANPSAAALTSDHLVNELPLSSAYTLAYAIYLSRKGEEGGITYGKLPRERVIEVMRRETGVAQSEFKDPSFPMRRVQTTAHPRAKPLNLVIVLEESLGAEFVGSLGGLPLTPNLDKLANDGLWFERLYATGTRSVRGIEAVIAGYPPTSAVSTVKLRKSQRDFFTIASFLKKQGYESTFFYGGESHFDNMRGFFMGNGFDKVVEQKDHGPEAFIATWGASDGDVFNKAHDYFSSQPADKPFFGLVFTSSNHAPFEFPQDQIELYEQPAYTVNNAVKYADHALGEFFTKAKKSNYWDNTLFLVISDHNSRVYGPSLVPVDRFHIPGLILGGAIKKPARISAIASQLDIAPTLISLMGLSGEHPMIGRDLSNPANAALPGRAIMQFDKIQAYMQGDSVVLLRPDKPATLTRYEGGKLNEVSETNAALIETAIAHSLYSQMAYRDQLHK